MKPLRIALLGAGRIGQVHARTIVQRVSGAQLVAIADPMPAAAQQLAKDAGLKAPTAVSFEYLQKPGTPGDTWASMMRLNARKLADALQQP